MAKRVNLQEIIEAVVRETFDGGEIDSVFVVRDVDKDGDDILRVKVIFDSKRKTLDPRKTSGLVRHIRPRVAKIGENAFPIISFIAKSEIRKAKTEAA